MTFKPWTSGLRLGPQPQFDLADSGIDPFNTTAYDTYQALNRVFAPAPDPQFFGGLPGYSGQRSSGMNQLYPMAPGMSSGGGGLPRYTRTGVGGAEEETEPVVGPMETYEKPGYGRGGRYENIGKFGVNVLGTGQGAPGVPNVYEKADIDAADALKDKTDADVFGTPNPNNQGFFEGVLGGLFGVAGEGAHGVGKLLGSAVDFPIEAIGNIAPFITSRLAPPGTPASMLGGALSLDEMRRDREQMGLGPLDPDLVALYEESAQENPINAMLMLGNLGKAQFQRDTEQGRRTGLMADLAPASSVTDQLGVLMAAMGFGQKVLARGVAGVVTQESARTLAQMAARGDTEDIENERWRAIAERAERGDFGVLSSQEARNKILDALVVEGTQNRDINDVEQTTDLPLGLSFQGLADFAFSMVTDPTILASGAVGLVSKGAKAATMMANTRFWKALPSEMVIPVRDLVTEEAKRLLGPNATGEEAWNAIARSQNNPEVPIAGLKTSKDGGFEVKVLNEVLNRPELANEPWLAEAREQLAQVTKWRTVDEPRYRPIVSIVRGINDPFQALGIGKGDRALGSIFDANATEGAIKGVGGSLDAHADLQNMLGEHSDDFLRNYETGLGVGVSNLSRSHLRNWHVRDLRRQVRKGFNNVIPSKHPDEVIDAASVGVRGKDIATDVEMFGKRVRRRWLAAKEGGEEAAIDRAKADSVNRLVLMGMDEADAVAMTSRTHGFPPRDVFTRDHAALLDLAYFGYATEEFTKIRAKAMAAGAVPKGVLDPERLAILGPSQMTVPQAEEMLRAVARGDMAAIYDGIERFDILRDNFSTTMKDADLRADIKFLLDDQLKNKNLPTEIGNMKTLPKAMREWAARNRELGYRPGMRPDSDDLWRATVDADGKIVGINPWIDHVGTASDVPSYTRWQLARAQLFGNIRGERIMADARDRLADYVTDRWGGTKADADALFARFIKEAGDSNITPRGMTPEAIYRIVSSTSLDKAVKDKISKGNAVDALLYAFEGNWRSVGLSQKFTGKAKRIGGGGNFLGQMAERAYPLVRFNLNPVFQAQEMVEPFILNTMRGIKPGFKASEWDQRTIDLTADMLRDGRYSFDDQMEYDAMRLMGADATRNAFPPRTFIGRAFRKISEKLDVKNVKRINFARAQRRQMGAELEAVVDTQFPHLKAILPAEYQTSDWGEIAVRYLHSKQGVRVGRNGEIIGTSTDMLKPAHLGAREPVNLEKVAIHFEGIETADELRAAVKAGDIDAPTFHDTLEFHGADPHFIDRAYHTAWKGDSPDEWWADWRTNIAGGNQRATTNARAIFKSVATAQGMSEEEYIAKFIADRPMTRDAATLAALPAAEKRHLRLMADLHDMTMGVPEDVEDALAEFRRKAPFRDREHFAIVSNSGVVLHRAAQAEPWKRLSNGMPYDASLGDEIADLLEFIPGQWMVHNHPSFAAFSPADIVTGVEFNSLGSIVESPGITYSLTPDLDEGWLTEQFLTDFPQPVSKHPKVQEAYFEGVRRDIHEVWTGEAHKVIANLQSHPFYADATGEQWDGYLEAIASQVAVKRIADRYGWTFKSSEHALLPGDPVLRHNMVVDFLQTPPPGLKGRNPHAFSAQPGRRLDVKAGAAVPLSLSRRDRPWLPPTLTPEQEATIMEGWEGWARSRVAPLFGTAITDVARGADNAMWDAWGTGEQIEDLSSAVGFLLRQDEVVSSRVKPGARIANPANGERWSLNFIGENPDAVIAQVNDVLPEVAAWGRPSVVKTADGRTAVRFVRADQATPLTRVQFKQAIGDFVERDFPVSIEARPEVVDFRQVSTDWETTGAEGFLGGLRTRRPDVVGQLEHGLAAESESQLAHLARAADPDAYDAHTARLTAAGERTPEFRIPGEYEPAPLADRLTVTLPGGRESFFDGERTLTLWEQQAIKSQRISATDLYNADPDLYVAMLKSIWRSKNKALDTDTERQAFNAFAFGALTGGASLDTTEGAFALLRAQTGYGVRRGIRGAKTRAQRIVRMLPPRFRGDPSHIGIAFQMDEGLRLSSLDSAKASWLSPGQRTDIDAVSSEVNLRMLLAPEEEREALAKTIQAELTTKGLGNEAAVHPFPVNVREYDALDGTQVQTFVSLPRPNMRMKGLNTNRTWGRVLKWLDDGIFDSESAAVQKFLRAQPNESRAAYALRMSSILPGIDTKTALMSMSSAGPGALAHGALDTHGVRYIAQSALKRGEIGNYWRKVQGVDFVATDDVAAFEAQITENTRNWNLSPHTPEEFARNKVYVNPEGDTGFMVTPEGDLQNVFNNGARGSGKAAVERAIAEGAVTLDAYDGKLPGYYAQFGFRETGRVRFVDEFAPEGYDIATQGRPDIVFMARTGQTDIVPSTRYFDDWDEAKAHSRTLVPEQAEVAAGAPPAGLLDRLTPGYADKLRRALQSGGDAFPSPESDKVFLVPAGLRDQPWSPAKLEAMRRRLDLIEDRELRALYDDDEVLRHVSETGGKVNTWGGDYEVMEDYFNTTLRQDEVAKLRAAGHDAAADEVAAMSGAEWQWFKWDQIRSGKGTPLDPHVGITNGADTVMPRTGGELDRAIRVQRLGSPYDPHMGALFQQMDGKIMGATQMMEDGRAIILATQHADSRTGMHELAHLFEQHLDPSMRDKVMGQFRAATGSTRKTWNRDVSEWWADSFLDYIKGGSRRGMDTNLRTSFEYFRKSINGVEATIKAQAEEARLVRGRATAITRATKAVTKNAPARKAADDAAKAANKTLEKAQTELRRARGRAGLGVLESKAAALNDEVVLAEQNLLDAKAAARVATQAAKEADVRANAALGSRGAGGARAQANAAARRVEARQAEVAGMEAALTKSRKARTEANRKVAGAKRRTPLTSYIDTRDKAQKQADRLNAKAATSRKISADAEAALAEAKARPTKPPKVRVVKPVISDEMQDVFDTILRGPKDAQATKYGPGSPIDAGAHYDIGEEAFYKAAQLALSRAEENAYTLHYYKRGRSFTERSINHPYFGLYPASYMWGKVLPEMLRFMLVSPFGLEAPLGGLALARNIYAQSMREQMYNEEFRKKMSENTAMFDFFALMTPALPWEIPVNAPLWLRRLSENSLVYDDKMAALREQYGDQPIPEDEMPPMMDVEDLGATGTEMLQYAFGPAQSVKQVAGLVTGISGAVGSAVSAAEGFMSTPPTDRENEQRNAAAQIEGVLRGVPGPADPLTPFGAPALPGGGTLPPQGQGYQP